MVNRLLEGVFPTYCVMCGLRSRQTQPLCELCRACLVPNHSHCGHCALPLPPAPTPDKLRLCPKCQQQPPPYDRVIAPWLYDEQMAALMHRWKFHGERYLTPLLAGLWLEQLVEPPIIDVIVPVPLHWWRLCQRGFNQAELLSHEIRHSCPSLHCAEPGHNFVSRRRHTHSQSRLTARGRAQNLTGAFRVRRPCDGLRLAIVDDVMTTGSTVAALAASLRDAGATSVEVWCIARTPAPAI